MELIHFFLKGQPLIIFGECQCSTWLFHMLWLWHVLFFALSQGRLSFARCPFPRLAALDLLFSSDFFFFSKCLSASGCSWLLLPFPWWTAALDKALPNFFVPKILEPETLQHFLVKCQLFCRSFFKCVVSILDMLVPQKQKPSYGVI